MIQGTVNARLEIVIRLPIKDLAGTDHDVEAAVDTGFTAALALPPSLVAQLGLPFLTYGSARLGDGTTTFFDVHRATIVWDGRLLDIEVESVGSAPLVGTRLLHGHRLWAEFVPGGDAQIEALP